MARADPEGQPEPLIGSSPPVSPRLPSSAALLFRLGQLAVRPLPVAAAATLGTTAGRLAARFRPDQVEVLRRNLERVVPAVDDERLTRLAVEGFASYGRYWAETLRLPSLSAEAIDRGFDVDGFEHIQAALRTGTGPIMVLPHLGGWEWAAAWLGRVGEMPICAVVERLEPDDVFVFFERLRSSYGVNVIPLGPDALAEVVSRVNAGDITCLLADRDLQGTGLDVEFFGATVRMPAGPALVARRTGAALLPTSVRFDGDRRICRILPPVAPAETGSLRADLQSTTQALASALEILVSEAPEQWHVLEPLWADSAEPPPDRD